MKKDMVQTKNPKSGKFVLIDRAAGRIVSWKRSRGPYKGVKVILALVLLSLVVAGPVFADTYGYYVTITVSDTGGADRTHVPVLTGIKGTNLNAAGYISASGLNTRLKETTTEHNFMVDTVETGFVIPTLAANSTRQYALYMTYDPALANMRIVPGQGGYITRTDHADLEPGSNFALDIAGHFVSTWKNAYLTKASAVEVKAFGNGTVGAVILPYNNRITQGAGGTAQNIWGVNWHAQTFQAAADYSMARITVTTTKTGSPTGDVTLSLRNTAAGVPDGADLVSVTVSAQDTAAGANAINIHYPLANGVTYALVLRYPTGTSGVYLSQQYNNADPYASGDRYTSADSGGTWNVQAGQDWTFVVDEAQAVQGAMTTGNHTVRVSSDATTLTLTVDSVALDTAPIGAGITDQATSWVWMAGTSMTALSEAAIYVPFDPVPTKVLQYKPTSMPVGTTVADDSGNGKTGTITWGANSNLTVTVGAITSYAAGAASTTNDTVNPANMPTGWFSTAAGGLTGMPFYADFNSAATNLGMSTQSLYLIMMMGVMVAVGLMVWVATGSLLLGFAGATVLLLAGINTTVVPVWMLFVWLVMGVGSMYLARKI